MEDEVITTEDQANSTNEEMGGIGIECLLTGRELDVFALLADGASDMQISAALSISLNGVYSQVRGIQRKLGTANRTETALLARTIGPKPPTSGPISSAVISGAGQKTGPAKETIPARPLS